VYFTDDAGHGTRPTDGKTALTREPHEAGHKGFAKRHQRNARKSIAFLIDPQGTWLQVGTPEANHCIETIARPATLHSAVETGGAISVEYSKSGVRVELNPVSVSPAALTSLCPRLSMVELPAVLAFRPVGNTSQTAASGAIAVRDIEARMRNCRPIPPGGAAPLASKTAAGPVVLSNGSYLVSPMGEWFSEDDQRLKGVIGLTDPALDAIGYAVRNMGFIRVSLGNPRDVTITLHPRNSEAGAINAAALYLGTLGSGRFHVRSLGPDGWVSEILPDGPSAARKVAWLRGIEAPERAQTRWYLTPLSLEALSTDDNNSLKLMHQRWRTSFGTFTESVLSFAMRFNLLDRLILSGAKSGTNDLAFRYIGDGMGTLHSEEFRFNAIGNSILQQPDKDYAEWVAAAYSDVAFSKVPRFDKIDAYLPGSLRGPWVRYERLLLPWTMPTGEVLVSMNSRITSDRMLRRPE
jgi:hypothetical protein